jgi:hypothetical protein
MSHRLSIIAAAGLLATATAPALSASSDLDPLFHPSGVRVNVDGVALELSLAAWGRSTDLVPAGVARLARAEGWVEYRRVGLVEWYLDDAGAIEQGFTVLERPAGEGRLRLELAFDGGRVPVSATVLSGADDARFEVAGSVLHYTGLVAFDATGRELEAALSSDGCRLAIEVDDRGAAYPLTIDPWIWSEDAKLIAGDPDPGDNFGNALAIDGDTAVICAWWDDNAHGIKAGAAYVFEHDSSGAWAEVVKLVPGSGCAGNSFGASAALDGDTAAVAAADCNYLGLFNPGVVHVFGRDEGGPDAWGEVAEIRPSTSGLGAQFGVGLAIDGDRMLVGAPFHPLAPYLHSGAAYIFERDPITGTWTEVAFLVPLDPAYDDRFGNGVALDGDTAVVGAYFDDLVNGQYGHEGAAFVYERDVGGPGAWGLVTKLLPSDLAMDDNFGFDVALLGDTVLVSSHHDDHAGGVEAGSVYVFDRNLGGPNNWGEVTKLTAANGNYKDYFGRSIALTEDLAVIGAYGAGGDANPGTGAAYLFERGPGLESWSQVARIVQSDPEAWDGFGFNVSLSGTTLLASPVFDNLVNGSGNDEGSAYVFGLRLVDQDGRGASGDR